MKTMSDSESLERAKKLREIMNNSIRTLTPQERDRRMQYHLAQARGPLRNLRLMFETTAMILRARKLTQDQDTSYGGQ